MTPLLIALIVAVWLAAALLSRRVLTWTVVGLAAAMAISQIARTWSAPHDDIRIGR